MKKKLEFIEFRNLGGLQGRKEGKDGAIYRNFKQLIDEVNRLNEICSEKPKRANKKEVKE